MGVSRSRPALAALAAVIAVLSAGCTSGSASGLRVPNLGTAHDSRLAPKIPAHGAYFGAWVRPPVYSPSSQLVAVDTLQSQLGRQLDIVHTYLTWQAAFPTVSDRGGTRSGQLAAALVDWHQ